MHFLKRGNKERLFLFIIEKTVMKFSRVNEDHQKNVKNKSLNHIIYSLKKKRFLFAIQKTIKEF